MVNNFKKDYLADFVYGGIDGSITTFAVVAGSLGASLAPSIVIILGCANLVGDGFSMAVANYLSVKSQREVTKNNTNNQRNPFNAAIVTYLSFIILGLIPLVPFIISATLGASLNKSTIYSVIFAALALFSVGAIKGLVVKKHWFKSGIETLIIGGIAASMAFGVGYYLQTILSR